MICPGAVEVLVFNQPHTVPEPFRGRHLVRHSPQITDVRLNKAEMIAVAHEVAGRLAHTKVPAVLLVPTGGFDSYAVAGEPFYDPDADLAFVAELRRLLPASVRLVERPTDINDPVFATEAAETLMALIEAG